MLNTRALVIVLVLTAVATLYSLSELHSLSAAHVAQQEEQDRQLSAASKAAAGGAQSSRTSITTTQSKQQTAVTLGQKSIADVTLTARGALHKCFTYANTELWGDVVVWGTQLSTKTGQECCDACRNYVPKTAEDLECNVWVWCGDKEGCKEQYQQCWLKHLAHPEATKPVRSGPGVPWTSGTLDVDMNADPAAQAKAAAAKASSAAVGGAGGLSPRRFHIVTSAQGAAVHWQARIHYYWYKKQKAACEQQAASGGAPCDMGGFTRLLHSGAPDDLMDEIPTMVVDPLPQDMVEHSWYVVLNRPYAFVQWVKKANIPEKYVLMAEPDHIFLRPLPNFMSGDTPAAFPFFYIEPAKHAAITQKFTGKLSRKQLEQIAPIGNSPTFMTFDDMARTMPIWMNTSIAIFKDAEANQAWGWVQEMYGFTIAAWLAGVKRFDLFLHMMAQPPWDTEMQLAANKPYYILHYTYGMDYKLTGEFTPGKIGEWRFDKRSYGGKPIPRNLGEPPKNMKNDLVRALINSFNEATDAIPCWEEYRLAGGKVPKTCTEAPKHFLAIEAAAKQGQQAQQQQGGGQQRQ